jgi:hypothetical protein
MWVLPNSEHAGKVSPQNSQTSESQNQHVGQRPFVKAVLNVPRLSVSPLLT